MADNNTKIILTAEDRTAAALAVVKGNLGGVAQSAELANRALAGIGVTFSGAAMVAMIKGTIDAADGFNDLAQRVGIGIKELAGWTLAANQSGTSMESVAKGVKSLSSYMVEHSDKLRTAGITATDANGAMIQLADLFKAMPDGVQKTALAVQLFGKAGMDMIPMLNQGSAGLAEAQEKAAEYGKRMAELAPQADKFNDQLAEMKFQIQLIGIEMASHVTGPMAQWLEANNEAVRIAGGFGEMLRLFVFNLDAMTTEKPAEEIRRLTSALQDYQAASGIGKFAQSPTGFLFGGRESDLQKQIAFLRALERQEAMAGAAKLGDYRDARDLSLTAGPTMARAKALMDKSGSTAAAKYKRGFDPEGDLAYAMDEAQRKAARAQMEANDKEYEALEKKRLAMEAMADRRMEETRIATEGEEAIRESMEKTNDALARQKDMAQELGFTFSSAFEDAIIGGRGLSSVMQGLAQDVARIFLRKQVTEPLGNALSGMFSGMNLFGDSAPPSATGGMDYPSWASGTDYVPADGFAMLHKGEAVIPASRNGDGGITVNIIEDSSRAGQVASRNSGGAQMLDVFVERVRSAIAGDIASGSGPVPAALGNTYGLNRAAGAY